MTFEQTAQGKGPQERRVGHRFKAAPLRACLICISAASSSAAPRALQGSAPAGLLLLFLLCFETPLRSPQDEA